jgi:hypothetical protein
MTERFLQLLASGLMLSFMACCVTSAGLQVIAWTRHAKEGTPVNLNALWRPEGQFDDTGVHQMKIARSALVIGAVLYLSYGVLMVVSAALAKG